MAFGLCGGLEYTTQKAKHLGWSIVETNDTTHFQKPYWTTNLKITVYCEVLTQLE